MTRVVEWLKRALSPVALVAGMGLMAQSEWQLALAVGWPWYVAWLAPVALDAYVIGAALNRKDMGPAILVTAVSLAASHGVYATPWAWSSGVIGEGHLRWWLAIICSVVPLLVVWRLHLIDAAGQQARSASAARKAKAAPSASASRAGGQTAGHAPGEVVARPVAVDGAPVAALVGRPVAASASQTGARAGARQAAIADAERFEARAGRLPELAELKDMGHAQRTAQRALQAIRDLRAADGEDEQGKDVEQLGEVA